MNGPVAEPLLDRFHAAARAADGAVLEGFHAVKHAIRFGARLEVVLSADPTLPLGLAARLAPDIAPALRRLIETVPAALFERLVPRPPPTGLVAVARRPAVPAHLLGEPRRAPLVLLDRPAHAGNVGAVIRTAAAAGAAGVVVVGGVDPWCSAALRGSAGLHWALPVEASGSPAAIAGPLIACDAAGEPLGSALLPDDAVLAFGSERHGLGAAWLERAERRIAIPMRTGVSSLNLAAAVAVMLYRWRVGAPDRG